MTKIGYTLSHHSVLPKIHSKWLLGHSMDEASVRYSNAVLVDDNQQTHLGDFLLNSDGSWTPSNGDEDVIHNLDGSKKLRIDGIEEKVT